MIARGLIPAALAFAGCTAPTVCGEGTTAVADPMTGQVTCTNKIAHGADCDPTTTKEVGGLCVGDPSKFPMCGSGTTFDPMSNTCVSNGMATPCMGLGACNPQMGKFAVHGFVRHLSDNSCAEKEAIEIRAYDPLMFLANPTGTMPQQVAVINAMDGSYCLDSLTDTSGMGLIAIAVTDTGGGMKFTLAGSGAQNVAKGGSYRVDVFAVEKSLVATWDTQAGLNGKFESDGAYLGIFLDRPAQNGDDSAAKPVAGVALTAGGQPAPNTFYFKGDMMTIDKSAMATDAATGAAVEDVTPGNLTTYSGSGGMVNGMAPKWEAGPGASTAGVVFIQKFHPMM